MTKLLIIICFFAITLTSKVAMASCTEQQRGICANISFNCPCGARTDKKACQDKCDREYSECINKVCNQ